MMNLRSDFPPCRAIPTALRTSRSVIHRCLTLVLISTTLAAVGNAAVAPNSRTVGNAAGVPSVNGGVPACEGEVAGKSPLQVALRDYVKTADPVARRFLTVVGSDSALSETGTKVLSEFGPTYYYAGSDAAKAALKDKLERVGPYPALLVVLRSNKRMNATTQSVRLGGHYVSGEFDGKLAISRAYTMTCAAAGWVIKESAEEYTK